MLERYSIIGLTFGLALLLINLILLRRRKIPGRIFAVWFIVGFSVCVVSVAPSVIYLITNLFGAEYSISAIVALGFSFFLFLFFYLHYKISELHTLLMKLTMQISVDNYRKSNERDGTKDKTPQERQNGRAA